MSNKVIHLEFDEDGNVKKKTITPRNNTYSSMFTKDNAGDIIKEAGALFSYEEIASGRESEDRGDVTMNESIEIFYKEIKEDMREREARTREEIKEREKRFEGTLTQFYKDNKEREERLFSAIEKLENKLTLDNQEMKSSLEKSEKNIDQSLKHLESIKTTMFWGQVAFIIGISSIIVAFISQIK